MDDVTNRWQPVPDSHPLAAIDGTGVGQGVRLAVKVAVASAAPANSGAASRFRAYFDSDEFGGTQMPFMQGLHHSGIGDAPGWLRVTQTSPLIQVEQGEVEVPEGIELLVIQALASVVPPGGQLLMEYDSSHRRSTSRALAQGVPPVATPLGGMMFSSGCGVAFTDRYRTGDVGDPRSLQGFRALDAEHEMRRGPQMLAELERFMATSAELDWDLQVKCRPLAEAAITVLRARLGVLSSDFMTVGADGAGATDPQ